MPKGHPLPFRLLSACFGKPGAISATVARSLSPRSAKGGTAASSPALEVRQFFCIYSGPWLRHERVNGSDSSVQPSIFKSTYWFKQVRNNLQSILHELALDPRLVYTLTSKGRCAPGTNASFLQSASRHATVRVQYSAANASTVQYEYCTSNRRAPYEYCIVIVSYCARGFE